MLILLAHRRYQYHYQIPFLDLVWDFEALKKGGNLRGFGLHRKSSLGQHGELALASPQVT